MIVINSLEIVQDEIDNKLYLLHHSINQLLTDKIAFYPGEHHTFVLGRYETTDPEWGSIKIEYLKPEYINTKKNKKERR